MWNPARVLHLSEHAVSWSRTASYNRGIAATVTALSGTVCETSWCMLASAKTAGKVWVMDTVLQTLCWMLTSSSHDSARSLHVLFPVAPRENWPGNWLLTIMWSRICWLYAERVNLKQQTHRFSPHKKKVWLSVQQLQDGATINRKWFNRFYTTAIDWTRGIPAALGLLAFISRPHRCPNPLSTAAMVLHQAAAWGDCINQNVERVTTSVAAVVGRFWTTGGLTRGEWATLCFQHSTEFGGNPA